MNMGFASNIFSELYGAHIPWGSSLINDYNFFSLSILIGLIFLSGRFEHYNVKIIFIIIFSVLFWSGWLAGSRRFLVLAPLTGLFLTFIFFRTRSKLRSRHVPEKRKNFDLSNDVIFVLFSIIFIFTISAIILFTDENLSRTMTSRISTFFIDDTMMGFAPRVERWQFAILMFAENPTFFGTGFNYRELFGCEFEGCKSYDYPHNPILSAILYGGVLASMLTIMLLFHALALSVRAISFFPELQSLGVAMLVIIFYCMISGDTFFRCRYFLLSISFCMFL